MTGGLPALCFSLDSLDEESALSSPASGSSPLLPPFAVCVIVALLFGLANELDIEVVELDERDDDDEVRCGCCIRDVVVIG